MVGKNSVLFAALCSTIKPRFYFHYTHRNPTDINNISPYKKSLPYEGGTAKCASPIPMR